MSMSAAFAASALIAEILSFFDMSVSVEGPLFVCVACPVIVGSHFLGLVVLVAEPVMVVLAGHPQRAGVAGAEQVVSLGHTNRYLAVRVPRQ